MISKFSRWAGIALASSMLGLFVLGTAQAGDEYADLPKAEEGEKVAIFAGGCFWCIEADFDKIPGVLHTTSGYIGGKNDRPNYQQVSYTETGHFEALHVVYDPEKVDYDGLLTAFWHSVDPTDDGGMFCDRGSSYRPAIFAVDDEQREKAEGSLAEIEEAELLEDPIKTPILDAGEFWPAEAYHQDYHNTNPLRYSYYRRACGRNRRVKEVWGDLAYKGIPKKKKK